MKNQLIPLTASTNTSGEYEPALVAHGFQYRQLVKADGLENSFHTKNDHQGFSFRRDLDGLVHRCGGMPIIQLDDGGLFAVKNADSVLSKDLAGKGWK